jgi:hypothetical protein
MVGAEQGGASRHFNWKIRIFAEPQSRLGSLTWIIDLDQWRSRRAGGERFVSSMKRATLGAVTRGVLSVDGLCFARRGFFRPHTPPFGMVWGTRVEGVVVTLGPHP